MGCGAGVGCGDSMRWPWEGVLCETALWRSVCKLGDCFG